MGCQLCVQKHPESEPCESGAPRGRRGSLEGKRHGPLLLRRWLGAGSLGVVYAAEHAPTGHCFAVKVLHPHLADQPVVRSRFVTEALATRKLRHPNIARVMDVRPGPGGLPSVLMELVEGEPLSRRALPLTMPEVLDVLRQSLAGLEAAHANGVVHRGLTLDNLVLARDARGVRCVKLLDFGASAVLNASLTDAERRAGMVAGSPAFLAPEQWTGAAVDGRADLYALGVAGYLLACGRLPFGFGRVGDAPPTAPHVFNARVPVGFSQVLLRALAQRPEERFADARAFREALEGGPRPATATPTGPLRPFVVEGTRDAETLRREAAAFSASSELLPVPSSRGSGVAVVDDAGAAPVVLMEATAPGTATPADLGVRMALPGVGFQAVAVSDVAPGGFFVACPGALPPLAARLCVELSSGGRALTCECDVVRHVTADEARTWGVTAGVFVHLVDVSEPWRQLLASGAPPAREPAPDAELEQLLARASAVARNPYRLLGAAPNADFVEIRRRGDSALSRLGAFQDRPLPTRQRLALESLRARVEAARRTLGEPLSRAGFDALRGNLEGVSQCLAAGLTEAQVEPLRRAFLAARPEASAQAQALFAQGHALESGRSPRAALAHYAQALAVDPLNLPWLRHYEALRRRTQARPSVRKLSAAQPVRAASAGR
ncbi:protein kinase [Corallococcus sp. M34]|uniref:serine/threonine-protein kinase n=1 Tax=Citreicoccus inhibens TaxID=2849499 RepID=UPI001C21C733|nr:serine/threonine-protein kinase [Citreicoccus inhibens]MBU8895556.1 protein kinase [Citreicoccus inhibens]